MKHTRTYAPDRPVALAGIRRCYAPARRPWFLIGLALAAALVAGSAAASWCQDAAPSPTTTPAPLARVARPAPARAQLVAPALSVVGRR